MNVIYRWKILILIYSRLTAKISKCMSRYTLPDLNGKFKNIPGYDGKKFFKSCLASIDK